MNEKRRVGIFRHRSVKAFSSNLAPAYLKAPYQQTLRLSDKEKSLEASEEKK